MITLGLTYDLKDDYLAQGFSDEAAAEFDRPETIEAIERALLKNGYVVERIGNIRHLVSALAEGRRWDIVFNICEGVKGKAREAQVPALLEAYNIPCVFSDAAAMVVTLDKAQAKRIVAEKGVPTARFKIVETLADIDAVDIPFPLFAKPLAEGTGKGISRGSYIETKSELTATCVRLLGQYHQPVLVEEYLPGRDLTVGIVGSGNRARVLGVMETFYKDDGAAYEGQSFYNKYYWQKKLSYALVDDPVAQEAARIALESWLALDCKDGGRVDLRCGQDDVPRFLEVNTLAGLQPEYSDLPMLAKKAGISYETLIGWIMEESCIRYGLAGMKPSVPADGGGERAVVLYSGGAENLSADDQDTLLQLKEISGALKDLGYEVFSVPFSSPVGRIETTLKRYAPAFVFNLVEAVERTDKLQYAATSLLDCMNIPYTGAATPAVAMLSSKTQMKAILRQCSIPTPSFYTKEPLPAGAMCGGDLRWIVKSDTEHASVGLNASSVIHGLENALRLIREKERAEGGLWFAEQYIDGREFNVAMIGARDQVPVFLPVAEIVFQGYPEAAAKIVDYAAKWDSGSFSYQATTRCYDFSAQDGCLIDRLQELSARCWGLFGLSGAARIDFRVDEQSRPWIVDININPCLSSDAGFMAAAARAGMTLADVVKGLIPGKAR